jgi:ankyrin repeat protein
MYALKSKDSSELVRLLLEAKADPNLENTWGKTAVFIAVENRKMDDLRFLLARGADLNHRDKHGKTVLTQEIQRKSPSLEVVKELIEMGADVNASLNLHSALSSLPLMLTLIDSGADVNASGANGCTPLSSAVSDAKRPMEIVEALFRAGALIDSVDAEGLTPLLHASKSGHVEAINFLLAHGASVTHTDAKGMSALHLAVKGWRNPSDLIPILLAAKADINAKNGQIRAFARPLVVETRCDVDIYPTLPRPCTVDCINRETCVVEVYPIEPRPCSVL